MMTQRGDPAAGVIAETPESTNRRSRFQNHGRCRGRGHRLQTSPFIRVDSCPSVVSPSRSSSETPHGASIALEPRRVIRGSNSIGGLNPPPVTCDALRPSVRLAAKRPRRRKKGEDVGDAKDLGDLGDAEFSLCQPNGGRYGLRSATPATNETRLSVSIRVPPWLTPRGAGRQRLQPSFHRRGPRRACTPSCPP